MTEIKWISVHGFDCVYLMDVRMGAPLAVFSNRVEARIKLNGFYDHSMFKSFDGLAEVYPEVSRLVVQQQPLLRTRTKGNGEWIVGNILLLLLLGAAVSLGAVCVSRKWACAVIAACGPAPTE